MIVSLENLYIKKCQIEFWLLKVYDLASAGETSTFKLLLFDSKLPKLYCSLYLYSDMLSDASLTRANKNVRFSAYSLDHKQFWQRFSQTL